MTTDLDFFELEEEAHPSSEQQIAEVMCLPATHVIES